MELWLDTIDAAAIEQAGRLGVLHGVTTNPAILAKATKAAEEVIEDLLNRFSGPIAVQVTLKTAAAMVDQGKDLYDFSSRIVVKIPATPEGFEAMYRLSSRGITVMATTIFEPMQAYYALQAGASYVVPYFSHLGELALPVALSIQKMLFEPRKLLIASLTTVEQVVQCAELGFSAVTLKEELFRLSLSTPQKSLEHLARFEEAWRRAPRSNLLTPASQVE